MVFLSSIQNVILKISYIILLYLLLVLSFKRRMFMTFNYIPFKPALVYEWAGAVGII